MNVQNKLDRSQLVNSQRNPQALAGLPLLYWLAWGEKFLENSSQEITLE
jgi:hypothetical protein